METAYIIPYINLHKSDLAKVGGKNSSLGELINYLSGYGINIPDGFATTSDAYHYFLRYNNLEIPLRELMSQLDIEQFSNLSTIGSKARELLGKGHFPIDLEGKIKEAYNELCDENGRELDVAVRSSATAEDLPTASFAGQHDSFLNRKGEASVLEAVHKCYVSLFNDRAIKYREDHGFDHMKVALSAGVQIMVRSDLASSGISFTLDPESGFRDIVAISGCWGLGENIVQGTINPDEFVVFKPTLMAGKNAILSKKLGSKTKTMIYSDASNASVQLKNIDTPLERQKSWVLSDAEITQIAKWSVLIEQHYGDPMDIEWAKDGNTGKIFILQARPETVHSIKDPFLRKEYRLKNKGVVITQGSAVGSGVAAGPARILSSPSESDQLKQGDVLVTDITNPDWDPILKKASAIITNKGGRTSHAAIVAREVGAVAVVGTNDATTKIKNGQMITVSCSEGKTGTIYDGQLQWEEKTVNLRKIKMPATAPMMILGDPDQAFRLSFYPNKGIGLMRLEFIINNAIRIHPMALVKYDELTDKKAKNEIAELTYQYPDKKLFFIDKLSQAVATIAAAFYPKEVIVRMSDFKTNEYANLIGGKQFEPEEENPMLGFRGASRYYHEKYREGFRLECLAMKKVREEMGFNNVKLMIPFCRTVDEGKKVVALMEEYGLKRGEHRLEIYVMAEIPSNVILAPEFAKVFDGFSIGSNDLTQLTLGLDRDSSVVQDLFDENNPAVKNLITNVIQEAHKAGLKIGLCGQAPSDFPEFANFLIQQGIDSISFNPDALLKGMENMLNAENASGLKLKSEAVRKIDKEYLQH